jgi:hypothetical protein
LTLHLANVFLAWRLLRKLLGPAREGLAWAAACLFACHWFALEAVTYLSALGVLWSTMGGLLAGLGVVRGYGQRYASGALLVLVGMVLALGGGEYCLATFPLLAACILMHPARRARWRWGVAVAVALVVLGGAYVAAESQFANHGRLGHEYKLGWHFLKNFKDNVAFLACPNAVLGADLCLGLLALGALLAMMRGRRDLFSSPPALWLLLGSLGALLPFAPSLQGNYARFLYPAAPFFCCWLLHLLLGVAGHASEAPRRRRLVPAGIFLCLVIINVLWCQKRAYEEWRNGETLREVVVHCQQLVHDDPERTLRVWVVRPCHYLSVALRTLDIVSARQVAHAAPPATRPPQENWLILDRISHGQILAQWQVGAETPTAGGSQNRR